MPVKSVLEVFLPMSARAFPLVHETGDKSRRREESLGGESRRGEDRVSEGRGQSLLEFRPVVLKGI